MLKLNALRKTMKNPGHYDYIDRMIDFIQYAYEMNSETCDIVTYKNALKYNKDNSIIRGWETLCRSYYETSIVYINNAERFKEITDDLFERAKGLMSKENELKCPVKY